MLFTLFLNIKTRKYTTEWKGGNLKTDKKKYFHLVPWQNCLLKGATELQILARFFFFLKWSANIKKYSKCASYVTSKVPIFTQSWQKLHFEDYSITRLHGEVGESSLRQTLVKVRDGTLLFLHARWSGFDAFCPLSQDGKFKWAELNG